MPIQPLPRPAPTGFEHSHDQSFLPVYRLVVAAYLASSLGQQYGMLLTFSALMLLEVGLVLRSRQLVTDAG